MNGWYIFLFAIIILLGIIWFTMIRLEVEYSRKQEKDQLFIEISAWWRVIRYKINVPLLDLEPQGIEYAKTTHPELGNNGNEKKKKKRKIYSPQDAYNLKLKIDSWLKMVHHFKKIMQKTLKKIRCDQLEWNTKIGLGDAAATGTFSGMVWGIKSCIIALIAHYISLRSMPRIQVAPQFQQLWLESKFKMRLRFRLGMVLIAGLKVYFNIIRNGEKLPK
jgi:hypothetical protein